MSCEKGVNLTYSSQMSVIATLVIGANGATALSGGSTQLSTPADRHRFLTLHRSAGTYITGRNSYQSESYRQAQAPVLILSRDATPIDGATVINTGGGLIDAMRAIKGSYKSPIVIEAGSTLFMELLRSGCIEECELSIVAHDGDSHFIEIEELLSFLTIIEDHSVDGTRLLKGSYRGSSAYS